jgi:cytochrome c2
VMTWNEKDASVQSRHLNVRSALDATAFSKEVAPEVNQQWFRATDVATRRRPDGWQVFVSHHVWDSAGKCLALALSTITLENSLTPRKDEWTVLFRTQPCLPIGGSVRGVPFAGLEAGGRLSWLNGERLLMTTGDHQFDGLNRKEAVAQDDQFDYGKTLVIDVTTGSASRFTKGHRNPQGLLVEADGHVWSTEHGPRGGDELNLLVSGGNYGWPYASYGTDYGGLSWPPSREAPAGAAFVAPLFAWVPSIGISNLLRVSRDRFPRWSGNLLIGSLRSQTLFRVVMDGDHVSYVEPLPVQRRVRDLIEGPSGDIWLWTDEGDLVTLGPAERETRANAAFASCAGCHIIDPDRRSGGLGPNLFGVVDSPVASNPFFAAYSPALRRVGGTWTPGRLDAFLTNPAAFAPGTTMSFSVSSPEERAALIAFLRARAAD